MPTPAVYLDECMTHPILATALRRRGFFVTTPDETNTRGLKDNPQLDFATLLDHLIASHNKKHFERWHERYIQNGWSHGGIILIPQTTHLLEMRLAMMLDWIGNEYPTNYRTALFIWGHLQQRLERNYQLPGYTPDDIRWACGR
jgi:hypothetical protein